MAEIFFKFSDDLFLVVTLNFLMTILTIFPSSLSCKFVSVDLFT